jgi:predicted dehydrogenase
VPIEVPDNWHLILDFGGETIASVTASNVAVESRAPQLELCGLQGTIVVDLLDVAAPVETLLPGQAWQQHALPHERASGPDHLLGVAHLIDCLTTGIRPVPSIDHAVHVIEIMEAAAESSKTGRAIELHTTFG